ALIISFTASCVFWREKSLSTLIRGLKCIFHLYGSKLITFLPLAHHEWPTISTMSSSGLTSTQKTEQSLKESFMILLIRKPDVLPEPGGPGINTPSCLLFLSIPILLPL